MPQTKNCRPRETPYERKEPRGQPVLHLDDRDGVHSSSAQVNVLFKDTGIALVQMLDALKLGDFVLFAMPKLENRGVIESLKRATRRGAFVLVLIQKEEWLRAGEDASEEQKSLRGEYNTVGIFDYGTVNSVLHRFYCIGGEWKFGDTSNTLAIRCLGDEAKISTNLIQESFVVFGTQRHSYATVATGLSPYVATTVSIGSYNVSNCDQFESVVRIRDDAIAQRYGEHFAMMFLNSEPLDWESAIARPEFTRIKN